MKNDKLSIFISLVLKHKPETIGIQLDEHGWADVNELIEGINNTGRCINKELLEEIVKSDQKNRYSFSEDKMLIRANQGHSIPVDVELEEQVPPNILYHGTAKKVQDIIMQQGIKSMSRLYVHLSTDYKTAREVGNRHGDPVVLKIAASEVYATGIKFYLSVNGIWLTKYVDKRFIIAE